MDIDIATRGGALIIGVGLILGAFAGGEVNLGLVRFSAQARTTRSIVLASGILLAGLPFTPAWSGVKNLFQSDRPSGKTQAAVSAPRDLGPALSQSKPCTTITIPGPPERRAPKIDFLDVSNHVFVPVSTKSDAAEACGKARSQLRERLDDQCREMGGVIDDDNFKTLEQIQYKESTLDTPEDCISHLEAVTCLIPTSMEKRECPQGR